MKFKHYLYIGVQFSRGCPFTCEFCDIIELYGRVPRAKTNAQMLDELEALHRLGYRGHVDFVDDNLIGNKKAVKAFLPELKTWLGQHDYPFEFTTEASLNLSDDADLLRPTNEANFIGVFIGIESPDTDTLIAMRKKQNTRRNIAQSIHRIDAAGLYVTAGFIVGFDSEKGSVADPLIELIEEAAIPICMVGLLFALPNTQLTRRLASEGRLHAELLSAPDAGIDQATQGLNFDTLRPRTKSCPISNGSLNISTIQPPMLDASGVWRVCSAAPTPIAARTPAISAADSTGWGLCIASYPICLERRTSSSKR